MAWRAIPGPLSKRKRRLDSLEAAQGAPRHPRRDSRGEQCPWLALETRPSKLYKMNNATDEITQLQTIKGMCASLFVCSDNGTYVYELKDCDLNYYSNEPNASPITVVNQ